MVFGCTFSGDDLVKGRALHIQAGPLGTISELPPPGHFILYFDSNKLQKLTTVFCLAFFISVKKTKTPN